MISLYDKGVPGPSALYCLYGSNTSPVKHVLLELMHEITIYYRTTHLVCGCQVTAGYTIDPRHQQFIIVKTFKRSASTRVQPTQ